MKASVRGMESLIHTLYVSWKDAEMAGRDVWRVLKASAAVACVWVLSITHLLTARRGGRHQYPYRSINMIAANQLSISNIKVLTSILQ